MRRALVFWGFSLLQGVSCLELLLAINETLVKVDLETNGTVWTKELDSPIYSVDYHPERTSVFHTYKNSIIRITEEAQTIVDNQSGPVNSLVVDWIHDTIYWSVGSALEIHMSDLDGYNHRLVVHPKMLHPNVTMLDNLAVDPFFKCLYFKVNGTFETTYDGDIYRNKVMQTDLYGNYMKIVHESFDVLMSMTVYTDMLMKGDLGRYVQYGDVEWLNFEMPIRSAVYGKGSPRIVISKETEVVYYKTNHTFHAIHGYFTPLAHINLTALLSDSSETIKLYDMVVLNWDWRRMPTSDIVMREKCSALKCSNRCVVLPSAGATCVCPPGQMPVAGSTSPGFNGAKCQDDKGAQVFITGSGKLSLWNVGYNTEILYSLPGITLADYDYLPGTVYYYNELQHKLFRSSLSDNPDPQEVMDIESGVTVSALAVDFVQHTLYWSSLESLNMVYLEIPVIGGGLLFWRNPLAPKLVAERIKQKVIISYEESGLENIKDIQLEPYKRMLFLLNKDNNGLGSVIRTDLQGQWMLRPSTKTCKSVSAISIGVKQGRLYMFCQNGDSSHISSTTLDFGDLITYTVNKELKDVTRMSVHGNMLYLVDFDQGSVLYEAQIRSAGNVTLRSLWKKESMMSSFRVFSPSAQMSSLDKKCLDKKCSHICQIKPSGLATFERVECVCPDSLVLSEDRSTCTEKVSRRQRLNYQ